MRHTYFVLFGILALAANCSECSPKDTTASPEMERAPAEEFAPASLTGADSDMPKQVEQDQGGGLD